MNTNTYKIQNYFLKLLCEENEKNKIAYDSIPSTHYLSDSYAVFAIPRINMHISIEYGVKRVQSYSRMFDKYPYNEIIFTGMRDNNDKRTPYIFKRSDIEIVKIDSKYMKLLPDIKNYRYYQLKYDSPIWVVDDTDTTIAIICPIVKRKWIKMLISLIATFICGIFVGVNIKEDNND